MNLIQHKNNDSMKVWLAQDEVDSLLEAAPNTQHRIAFALAARCGLRSHEVLDVAPDHLADTPAGPMLNVHHGKGDKFRQTPAPGTLVTTIETIDDVRDAPSSAPVVEVSSTRTLRRWLSATTDELAETTGNDEWRHVSFHDLRRTWATSLSSADVDALLALEWGGWNSLDTFLDHYKGPYTPEAQRRERDKVGWL